ncbi:PKD domain-containing protein [Marinoscillum furvescens]|nr:PKD domain-containing protein [Marinoscillum furvescens]
MKNNLVLQGRVLMSILVLALMASCETGEDAEPEQEDPIASFQFEVSTDNFLEVTFSNFSKNATSYAWDFGDGNTSEEESPVHTFETVGTYEVTLTASNEAGVSATKTNTVAISDPDAELTKLAGLESKTWILQREGVALGIGPAAGDTQWWSFGGVTPLGDRPCILDDEYTFKRDGSFELNSNGTLFTDGTGNGGWNDSNIDLCGDEASVDWTSAGGIDMSAYQNGGAYTYTFADGTLKLMGDGVYVGLANKTNAGDIGTQSAPQSELTYSIVKLVDNDDVDSLQIALQVNGEAVFWTFNLVHYDDESKKPAIPAEGPKALFDFSYTDGDQTVTFTNSSRNATSYTWDFGDGNTSTDENPVHTYSADGVYSVTLTATDGTTESVITKAIELNVTPVTDFVIDHESAVTWDVFGGSVVEIVANPDASGLNTSANVLKLTHGDQTWAGIVTQLDGPLDFTGKTKMKVKLWAPATGTLKFKLEGVGGEPNQEIDLTVDKANEWVELTWDLSTDINGNPVASNAYSRVVLFPGWDTTTADVYYIDDITME